MFDDTASGAFTPSGSRLVNLSCKSNVAGSGTLILGFFVGGSTSRTLLVRASGPNLAAFVAGTMPDPQLQLYDSSGNLVLSNAGWGGDPQVTAAGNSVHAFPLSNSSSLDSVLLLTLPPGGYTAQASSVSGAGGV